MADDFTTRVADWIAKTPLDALTFTEAVVLSRAVGSLLVLGISEGEIRSWVEHILTEARSDSSLLDELERVLVTGKGTHGTD